MKKNLPAFFILLVSAFSNVHGQKLQYSRGVVPVDDPGKMQFVSNISGYHHLLFFGLNKKPAIYIFNSQLQLVVKKEIDFSVRKDYDLRIISFDNYYLVYTHALGSSTHNLWKIDGKGSVIPLSKIFQKLADSLFRKTKATLQLINAEKSFYVVSHTYYDSLKAIKCTAAQLNGELHSIAVHKVVYPFNKENEFLNQTTISGNHLYVLKNARDDAEGNTLQILKVDLNGGRMVMNSFNSSSHEYSEPVFQLNEDSSVLVYAMIRESSFTRPVSRAVFIARLDNELKEQSPVVTLKSQFTLSTLANFLYLDGQRNPWLCVHNYTKILRSMDRLPGNNYSYLKDLNDYNYSFGVKLSILDQQLKVKRDSLIENNRKVMDIQPYPYGQFTLNNKGYLVLIQNFAPKRRGLVIVALGKGNHFSTIGLPVYERNGYLLDHLKVVDKDYFIVPYLYKYEMGLLKVPLANIETSIPGN